MLIFTAYITNDILINNIGYRPTEMLINDKEYEKVKSFYKRQ